DEDGSPPRTARHHSGRRPDRRSRRIAAFALTFRTVGARNPPRDQGKNLALLRAPFPSSPTIMELTAGAVHDRDLMTSTILIADDDPVQRRLLEAMVRRFGYLPEVVEGGEAALDRLCAVDQPAVDLLILDLVMPDL